ncbi:MAG: VCBS repeat-containing protein [Alkalinema sp. RL_2_19]|nr:VCBS repeat-containing protein [Alkalinema sp. RL_2_19]
MQWDSSWNFGGAADFNGDGVQDHLYHNGTDILITTLGRVDGQTATLESAVSPLLNGQSQSIPDGWTLVGAADMTGDGIGDLIFRSQAEDATAIWQIGNTNEVVQQVFVHNAAGTIARTTPTGKDSPWTIDGFGDFDGDGDIDLLYRWSATGQMAIWQMDGFTVETTKFLNGTAPSGSSLHVGDFNGDGIQDVIARNPLTDVTQLWSLDRQVHATETLMSKADIGWEIQAIADMNGDGTDDLIWQHQGQDLSAVWMMQDGMMTTGSDWIRDARPNGNQALVKTGDPHWEIQFATDRPRVVAKTA